MSDNLMSLEDQARLNRTQDVRERIIAETMKDGKIPDDREDRDFLMKALDGMDRQVLAKAKIKSDDQNSKSQLESANMIANLLLQVGKQHKAINNAQGQAPELEGVELVDPVPGETEIGVKTFRYNDVIPPVDK